MSIDPDILKSMLKKKSEEISQEPISPYDNRKIDPKDLFFMQVDPIKTVEDQTETIQHTIEINPVDTQKELLSKELKATIEYTKKAKKDEGDEYPEPTGRSWLKEREKWFEQEEIDESEVFAYWYKEFIIPSMGENAIELGKIHYKWAGELEESKFSIHLEPRDHYKTSFITIGHSLYNLCERRFAPGLLVFESEANTSSCFETVKFHLLHNEKILDFYGGLVDASRPLTKEKLYLLYQPPGEKTPGLTCSTYYSKSVTGLHPKFAKLDDIQDRPFGQTTMQNARHMIEVVLLPAMGRDGEICVVGTFKGFNIQNDIYLYLIAKEAFEVYRHPAIYLVDQSGRPILDNVGNLTPGVPDMKDIRVSRRKVAMRDKQGNKILFTRGSMKGKPKLQYKISITILKDKWKYRSLYPERYSVEDIIRKRIELNNDDKFLLEYLLLIVSPKGNLIPVDRIGLLPFGGFNSIDEFVVHLHAEHIPIIIWVDCGSTKGHGLAISVIALDGIKSYILELCLFRRGTKAAGEYIYNLIKRFGASFWACEPNGGQSENYGLPIETALEECALADGHPELALRDAGKDKFNQGEKMMRIRGTVMPMIGLEGQPTCLYINPSAESYDVFMIECKAFPRIEKGMAHEYDLLDSITSIKIHFSSLACGSFFALSSLDNARLFG